MVSVGPFSAAETACPS